MSRVLIGPPVQDPAAPTRADLDAMTDITELVVTLTPDLTGFTRAMHDLARNTWTQTLTGLVVTDEHVHATRRTRLSRMRAAYRVKTRRRNRR